MRVNLFIKRLFLEFQQKISLISKKATISKSKLNIQKTMHQIDLIKQQIQDQGLEYQQNSIFQFQQTLDIFKRYATIQQMTLKKKNAAECCYHCGEEMKKTVQCELCAEMFCKNCCWRKRVVPLEQHADFRLSCEQCHENYIKFFNNQEFYKQKAIYQKVLEELQRKYQKSQTKHHNKQLEINQYKKQKQADKLKQAILKKSLLDQDKRIQLLKQQFTQLMKQKAQRNYEQETNKLKQIQNQITKQREQKEKTRVQEQKIKHLQNIKTEEEKLIIQQVNNIVKSQKQKITIKQLIEQKIKQKQSQPAQLVITKVQHIQKLPLQQIDFDQILNGTFDAKKKKSSKQQDKKVQIDKKETQHIEIKSHQNQGQNQKTIILEAETKDQNIEVNPQKEQQTLPEIASITMNQIKSMNINDLLAMKIPMNPGASPSKPSLNMNKKKQEFLRRSMHESKNDGGSQHSTTTQKEKEDALIMSVNDQLLGYVSNIDDQKQQVFASPFVQEYESQSENALKKSDILRRSSLMSSTNQNKNKKTFASETPINQQQQQQAAKPQKCACQIM